jgi:serine protease DegQ
VLVGVGDKPVMDSTSLLNLIAVLAPGKAVQLRLIRDQVEMRLMVTVEKRPAPQKTARE